MTHSFACGLAGGPAGLRPQQPKHLTDVSAAGRVSSLLGALTSFLNLVLQGRTPDAVCPFFFLGGGGGRGGAFLVTLSKTDGGVRSLLLATH